MSPRPLVGPGDLESTLSGHGGAAARIAAGLRDAILAGEYAPGDRVRQEEVAGRHGASRLPVREALRMLAAEGLVTLVANTGAWVSALEPAECDELYRVRERLEPLLLAMNVPLLTEDTADELDELAREMEEAGDTEEFLALDRRFHFATYAAATTITLGDSVTQLWNRTQHYRRAFTRLFQSDGDRSAHYDHRLIVAAIRRRDAEEAERVLADHIRRTRLALARHPEIFVR
ncbi:GntR family transcriptional regulator [Agromyces binzhouensis]|uniref:GntR family transcriptional regulator n=1 Tax=Agromyces binzhouensis TaxID=1817495 RepID=UPI00363B8D46